MESSKTAGKDKRKFRFKRCTPLSAAYLSQITAAPIRNEGESKAERDDRWRKELCYEEIQLQKPVEDVEKAEEEHASVFSVHPDGDVWGPNHREKIRTPLDAVLLLFGDFWETVMFPAVLKQIAMQERLREQRVLAGRKTRRQMGQPVKHMIKACHFTVSVFHKFLAVWMLLGVKQVPTGTDVWNRKSPHHSRHVTNIMGRDRWMAINATFTKATATEESFYELYQGMNKACQNIWRPSQVVAVDETLLHFTGWFRHHYCIPRKPAKNGVKIIGLVDSAGWFFAARLCKRKTLDGTKLPTTSTV
jgi:hypothetical protein